MNKKNIILYMILGGLFLVPFIPFIVLHGTFFPFITGKGFIFRILVEIVFGLYLILAFSDKNYRPKFSWITKSVLFFTLVTLVADLFSANVYKSLWSNYERMEGFVLIIHLAAYYIVASSVLNASLWKKFWNISIFSSVIMSFYGVFQLLGKLTINQGGVRLDGTFGNATYLAIYLVFHIFLCLYLAVESNKTKWLRWIYVLIAVFEIIILYFTATRGATIGLVGGLLLTGMILAFKEKENLKLRKLAYGLLGAVAIVVVGFLALRNSQLVKNSPVLSRFATLSASEFKSQGRYFVWPMGIKGFLQRPILGWGQESFNFVFNKYYDPRMLTGQEQWFDRTHDVILDWLINGGIVGLASYVLLYVAMFYHIWRRKSNLKLAEKSILTGMISAYIFHNIFVFDNLISYIFFFSILAFVHGKTAVLDEIKGKLYLKVFSKDVLNYVITPIVLILTVATIYFVNVSAILANRTLIKAISQEPGGLKDNLASFKQVYAYNSFGNSETTEQLSQIATQVMALQIDPTTKNQFIQFAYDKVEQKVKETPHDARYLVFAGSLFNRTSQYDKAIDYLNRALVESPKKQTIIFELGTSYLAKRDYQKVFELFKRAYDLDQTAPESKIIYAVGAIYAKNEAVLKEVLPQIDQSMIIFDNRIIKAYADIGDYNTVIAILNKRLEKDPNDLQNKLSLAYSYSTIGQKQKAIGIIEDLIKHDPSFKTQGESYIKQIQNQ